MSTPSPTGKSPSTTDRNQDRADGPDSDTQNTPVVSICDCQEGFDSKEKEAVVAAWLVARPGQANKRKPSSRAPYTTTK